jgi:hypothetical protein
MALYYQVLSEEWKFWLQNCNHEQVTHSIEVYLYKPSNTTEKKSHSSETEKNKRMQQTVRNTNQWKMNMKYYCVFMIPISIIIYIQLS